MKIDWGTSNLPRHQGSHMQHWHYLQFAWLKHATCVQIWLLKQYWSHKLLVRDIIEFILHVQKHIDMVIQPYYTHCLMGSAEVSGTWQYKTYTQHCFILPGPPYFFISRQKAHTRQFSAWQPSQWPHRGRLFRPAGGGPFFFGMNFVLIFIFGVFLIGWYSSSSDRSDML